MSSNDNFIDERDMLLTKAKDIVDRTSKPKYEPCSLMAGGPCPLLSSSFLAFKNSIKE